MHYYIDGYNLLFRLLKGGDDIRKQREEITRDIEKKVNSLELDATLVFDSHYQEDGNTRSHFKTLEIIFTATGETADEFILQELKESNTPSQHTVVTSDKKLARLCQLRLGKTESVDEFLAWTSKRYNNKLRHKKLQDSKPVVKKPTDEQPIPKPPPPPPLPTPQDAPKHCFNYYLETFEKEMKELETVAPLSKKIEKEPKKPKLKKRPLTKEEAQLSDLQRWQKAFEKNSIEESENII